MTDTFGGDQIVSQTRTTLNGETLHTATPPGQYPCETTSGNSSSRRPRGQSGIHPFAACGGTQSTRLAGSQTTVTPLGDNHGVENSHDKGTSFRAQMVTLHTSNERDTQERTTVNRKKHLVDRDICSCMLRHVSGPGTASDFFKELPCYKPLRERMPKKPGRKQNIRGLMLQEIVPEQECIVHTEQSLGGEGDTKSLAVTKLLAQPPCGSIESYSSLPSQSEVQLIAAGGTQGNTRKKREPKSKRHICVIENRRKSRLWKMNHAPRRLVCRLPRYGQNMNHQKML